jgi:hypothetical protein
VWLEGTRSQRFLAPCQLYDEISLALDLEEMERMKWGGGGER